MNDEESDEGLSSGAIIGLVCGGVFLICIGMCIYSAWVEYQQDLREESEDEADEVIDWEGILREQAEKNQARQHQNDSQFDFKVEDDGS